MNLEAGVGGPTAVAVECSCCGGGAAAVVRTAVEPSSPKCAWVLNSVHTGIECTVALLAPPSWYACLGVTALTAASLCVMVKLPPTAARSCLLLSVDHTQVPEYHFHAKNVSATSRRVAL